jgi:hypothetical protein
MRLKIAGRRHWAVTLNSAMPAVKSGFRITVAGIDIVRNVKALSGTDGLNPDCRKCLIASIFTMFLQFPNA